MVEIYNNKIWGYVTRFFIVQYVFYPSFFVNVNGSLKKNDDDKDDYVGKEGEEEKTINKALYPL